MFHTLQIVSPLLSRLQSCSEKSDGQAKEAGAGVLRTTAATFEGDRMMTNSDTEHAVFNVFSPHNFKTIQAWSKRCFFGNKSGFSLKF